MARRNQLQAVIITAALLALIGLSISGVTKRKPVGFGREYWKAQYRAKKTHDESVQLLKKYFDTEQTVISSHEYRQFLIEYALIGKNESTIKKPILEKIKQQYSVMADEYIKFLEKYPEHPVTYDFLQALIDYESGTLFSFIPKEEVTEEQLNELFFKEYNDPNTSDATTKFIKEKFPSTKTKVLKTEYQKFLLEHLTESYKGSKITKKDMNIITSDYQIVIEKYLASKQVSGKPAKSEFSVLDAIEDVAHSKLINFLYEGNKEKYTKEYFLKHYDAPTSDDKDVILIKKYLPTKESTIDRKTYFELILNYLTIGMSREDSKSAKKKLERAQKNFKKDVNDYFSEKEKGGEKKQKFGFSDVLEDLISGNLLTFTHSHLIPEYQAHSGSFSGSTSYLPYIHDPMQNYGYEDTENVDVDL